MLDIQNVLSPENLRRPIDAGHTKCVESRKPEEAIDVHTKRVESRKKRRPFPPPNLQQSVLHYYQMLLPTLVGS
jgi:hypothetical protein